MSQLNKFNISDKESYKIENIIITEHKTPVWIIRAPTGGYMKGRICRCNS